MQDKMRRRFIVLAVAFGLLGAAASVRASGADPDPERGGGGTEKSLTHAHRFMMAAAHPLATQAGYDVLRQGGSAMDAVLAAQLVLNLVEPQSSGLGGGAFLVYYDSARGRLHGYDGRERAPAAAAPDWFLVRGEPLGYEASVDSGLSVGVPGLARLLEMAHRVHGRLPWRALFEPAIRQAEIGFPVTMRLHLSIRFNRDALAAQPAASRYFLDGRGQPWPVGHTLKNPALAQTLRLLADQGTDAFYRGAIARDIVDAVRSHERPGSLSLADLEGYRAIRREPLCGVYRAYRVCGMPPPGSGMTVLQMLGILEQVPMPDFDPLSVDAVHYFSEAGRLAYADRDRYLADPAFIDIPVEALLSERYLRSRAALLRQGRSMGRAEAGEPLPVGREFGQGQDVSQASTSHLVAVDAQGDVASLTTTIEAAFGSKILVRGFLLNNELTDFSRVPKDAQGHWVANRVEPEKRPRSAMSPTIVFRNGVPVMAVGAPGGPAIVNFVAKTLVGVLDWGLDIQQAIALPHFGSRNACTELELDTVLRDLEAPLRARGHDICYRELPSGIQAVVIKPDGLQGGADPRREGRAQGD